MTDHPTPERSPFSTTSYAFAEILKLADQIADELTERGPRCEVPVILGVMAVESLLNDLAHFAARAGGSHAGAQALGTLGEHIDSAKIKPRLLLTYHLLTGDNLRTDVDPFQAFGFLVDLRNAYVHATPEEWLTSSEGAKTAVRRPRPFVNYLAGKKIAPGAVTARDLMTPEVARWAVLTAGEVVSHMMTDVAKSIPQLGFMMAAMIGAHYPGPGKKGTRDGPPPE